MIPTYIGVKNFMCYRDTVEVDLRGIRTACLSGDNGAGKSALLDCMTWALWGKARVNSDRELLALSADEMEVTLGFLLNDQEFRVIRRRAGRGAGRLTLELQIRDGDRWRTLSGSTARETQAAIDNLLRMNYDTFINSAFILQGRADEFTTKTPAMRKQVLVEILNLDDYDRLEDLARAEFRERDRALRDIDARLDWLDDRLSGLPEHRAEVTRLSQELVALSEQSQTARDRLEATQTQLSALEFMERQRVEIRQRLERIEADLACVDERRRQVLARIARHRAIIARREEIEARHRELRAARERGQTFTASLAARQELNERRQTLQRSLQEEIHRVETELRSLEDRIESGARALAGKPELLQELARVRATAGDLDAIDREIHALRQRRSELDAERGELKARNDRLYADMRELKARMEQIGEHDAVCPVCRRELGPDDRAHIHASYTADGTALADQHRANARRVRELETASKQLEKELAGLETRRGKSETLIRQAARLEARLQATEETERDVQALRERLDRRRQELEADPPGGRQRGEIEEIERELARLPYDREEHQAVVRRIQELAPVEEELRRLDSAVAALEGDERELQGAGQLLDERRAERDALRKQVDELDGKLEALEAVRAACDERRAELDRMERRRHETQERFGAAQQRLNDCLALKDERDDLRRERDRVVEERAAYDELTLAFGKRGIQAMIIENIVPELQEEANRILDMMPGNSMRVEFRTQRQALSGDSTIETLDIVIGDEAGRRAYELYSGGEAFRANFAIRVALSTLLARRAGTRLQTLVIDEGFGTQDSRGRDGLVEAIRAIEPDFQMILVITHIADLKEVFPNRIDVVKTVNGSQVFVN